MNKAIKLIITLSIVFNLGAMPALAVTPVSSRVITLDEAESMALKSNYGVKNKEQTIIRAEEARKQGVDAADALRVSEGASWVADSYAKSALVGLQTQTNNVAISERKVTLEKESLVFAVRSACDSLRNTQGQLAVLNKKLNFDQRKTSLAGLQQTYGLESEYGAGKAEDDLKQQQALKSQLEKTLETAYVKLNRLIGLKDGDRYEVAYDVTFKPLAEKMPSVQAGADPYLWILEKQLAADETRLKLYTISDSVLSQDESYKGREAKKKITDNAYWDTNDKLTEAVKTRFYQIKQIEDQEISLAVKTTRAEKTAKLVKLQFEVGMATALDVQGAELALASAKQEYDTALVNHATLVLIYRKPYLLPDYLSADYGNALGR